MRVAAATVTPMAKPAHFAARGSMAVPEDRHDENEGEDRFDENRGTEWDVRRHGGRAEIDGLPHFKGEHRAQGKACQRRRRQLGHDVE